MQALPAINTPTLQKANVPECKEIFENFQENFQEIINSGDFEAFKSVFDKCEITATSRGKSTCNAFSYRNLKPYHIQFLIDNGLEVNADCGFGYPAVAFLADNKDNLKCLLQNGADIDKALSIVDYDGSGNVKPYDIYGEHNKPTPEDLGAFPFIDARTGIDMDDIIKSGIHFGAYRVGNSTGGTPYKYGKSSYAYGMIFSAGASTTSAMQIAFLSGSQYPFHRYFRDGKITEWFGLYTEGHLPTLGELGAAPAAEHKIKEYYDLEQIGVTKGDTTAETIENIASKLPNYSMLMYFVGDGNNISEYPSGYGLIRAYKIQNTRTVFEFTSHMTNDFYYGICYDGSFKGWSQVYDTSNPPPVFSAGTKAPTNEKILWINTSNNTINYHTGSEWKSIGAVFG